MNRWEALVFNAVTAHPECTVLFSSRQKVSDRVSRYLTKQVRRMERQVARRKRKWERRERRNA